MTNQFADLIERIARNFSHARTQPLKDHPLAKAIRQDWSQMAKQLAKPKFQEQLHFTSSPGAGQWNSAPWLAVLHPQVTTSAQSGYYPVYLFEPDFKTVCLVMGQGAERLEQSVGKARALVELKKRADRLRKANSAWSKLGFNAGPFNTTRDTAAARKNKGDKDKDPWAESVAFGIRYHIAELPNDAAFADDLNRMLKIYSALVSQEDLNDTAVDEMLAEMAVTGELPFDAEGGVDGAKRVAYHKKYEYRHRNKALIIRVKKKLGSICQGCSFEFKSLYGQSMDGFIEAHHSTPISELPDTGATLAPTEDHFMVLCSNCHRAIHAAGCPDLPTFKAMLKGRTCVSAT